MSNFGRREHLLVDGVPVGRELKDWPPLPEPPERSGARPSTSLRSAQEARAAQSKDATNPEQMGSSIIIVLAADAPLDPRQLERMSVRAGAGLARTGGLYSTSSGDFVIAFSTTNRVPHVPEQPVIRQDIVAEALLVGQDWPAAPAINYLLQAALEATEEAILNSLFAAETMVGRDDRVRQALPIAETVRILQEYGHKEVRMPEQRAG